MRRLLSLTPVVMFALVLIELGFSLTNDPRKMPSMLMDKATPTFALASLDEDGKGLSSTDLMLMQLAENGTVPIYGINAGSWLEADRSPMPASALMRAGGSGSISA